MLLTSLRFLSIQQYQICINTRYIYVYSYSLYRGTITIYSNYIVPLIAVLFAITDPSNNHPARASHFVLHQLGLYEYSTLLLLLRILLSSSSSSIRIDLSL